MANNVTHRLTFSGPEEVIALLKKSISTFHESAPRDTPFGEEIYVDPEDKLPCVWLDPKTKMLTQRNKEGTTVPIEKMPDGYVRWMREAHTDYIDFNKIIPAPSYIFAGDLSMEDEKKNPNRNWMKWNIKHWGTKWGAYDTSLLEDGAIKFDAAWSFVEPVIVQLSWLFPEVTIDVEVIDEGWNFWGTGIIRAGEWKHKDIRTAKTHPCDYKKKEFDSLLVKLSKELRDRDILKEADENEE